MRQRAVAVQLNSIVQHSCPASMAEWVHSESSCEHGSSSQTTYKGQKNPTKPYVKNEDMTEHVLFFFLEKGMPWVHSKMSPVVETGSYPGVLFHLGSDISNLVWIRASYHYWLNAMISISWSPRFSPGWQAVVDGHDTGRKSSLVSLSTEEGGATKLSERNQGKNALRTCREFKPAHGMAVDRKRAEKLFKNSKKQRTEGLYMDPFTLHESIFLNNIFTLISPERYKPTSPELFQATDWRI